ncbi:MAG TPA: ferrochelatase [Steroidobacteraceae bacterium]|nr:ferrochelatase [Steroidobacteraceae bacterium]
MRYISSPDFQHDGAERIGVLLVNSGTPDSLSVRDVRRFLAGLLGDPRVVELPRLLWLPLLHGLILRTRPRRSARKYARIWTGDGSPLAAISRELRVALAGTLAQRVLAPFSIELGMLYARPSVSEALTRLRESGAQRILVVPLFPQYCGASTGAVYDQVSAELARWRWLPELRFIAEYHDYPPYIEALRSSVEREWRLHGRTRHLLMSFHGVPERTFQRGDPYYCKCQKTARLLADELMLEENAWSVAFQSRFGAARWLQPYTSEVLEQLPASGIDDVTVICPGFAIDCLETLEEIDIENRQRFLAAGGRKFLYVPSLNASAQHAALLAELIAQHCQGWTHIELGFRPAGAARGASA